MKKILALVLSVLMAVSMLAACGSKEAPDFKFRKNDDKQSYTLVEYIGTASDVTIPGEYKGLPVTKIDGAFGDCTALKRVVIPEGVQVIGDQAFRNCSNLETVVIPGSVRMIGYYAFSCCSSLTELNIPQAVDLDWFAFLQCTGLQKVTLGSEASDGDCEIGRCAFSDCDNLTEVVIGNGYTRIGGSAFEGCDSLTTVTLPGGLKEISLLAFGTCPALTDMYFNGTQEAWQNVDLDSMWIEYAGNLVIHIAGGNE